MPSQAQIEILLRARDEASKDLQRIQRNIDTVGASAKRQEFNIKKLGVAFAGLSIGTAGLVAGIRSTVGAFQEQERAERTLAQIVENTGTAFADVRQEIMDTTAALQNKTSFGDEMQLRILTQMIPVLGSVEKAQAALPAILDAASASGRSASSVAVTLTKALAGQADVAESVGLKFDKAAGFQQRLQTVMDSVGGSAEANADPFIQMGNAVGDLGEAIGSVLVPALEPAVRDLQRMVETIGSLIGRYNDLNDALDITPTPDALDEFSRALEGVRKAAGPDLQNQAALLAGVLDKLNAKLITANEALKPSAGNLPFRNMRDEVREWSLLQEQIALVEGEVGKLLATMFGLDTPVLKLPGADSLSAALMDEIGLAVARTSFRMRDLEEAAELAAIAVGEKYADAVETADQAWANSRAGMEEFQKKLKENAAVTLAALEAAEELTAGWDELFERARFGETDIGDLGISMDDLATILLRTGADLDKLTREMREDEIAAGDLQGAIAFLEDNYPDLIEVIKLAAKEFDEQADAALRAARAIDKLRKEQERLTGKALVSGGKLPARGADIELAFGGFLSDLNRFGDMEDFLRNSGIVDSEGSPAGFDDDILAFFTKLVRDFQKDFDLSGVDAIMRALREIMDIAALAHGGNVTRSGLALVGEAGPEILNLPRGAQVTPLGAGVGGGNTYVVNVNNPTIFGEMDMQRLIGRNFQILLSRGGFVGQGILNSEIPRGRR